MSKVVQFNFEKSNDKEIEINGELHVIPMDDDSKDKYVIATKAFGAGAKLIEENTSNLMELTDEEIKELTTVQRDVMKGLIEAILGTGKFNIMYSLAGRSVIKLMPLAQELLRLVSDVSDEQFDAIQKQYLQNGKK